ncbi:MAG: ATP-dependent DNA ligase [Flavisolibacter sp.]
MAAGKFTDYYKPILATLADEAFDHKDWIFELKLDGYRAVAELSKKKVKLYSRNGLSFADRYPAIVAALQKISRDVVLDGEVVLFNENGHPDFQKLQHYEDNRQLPLYYYVFDLISIDGKRYPSTATH